jgi:nucleoside-diphosphate-sugar epimerase
VRVVVLGGTGFIGGALVRRFVAMGHDVVVFHRGRTAQALPGEVREVLGDLARIADHAATLRRSRPDVVVDSMAFTEADVHAVHAALRGAAPRLVVLSSLDVYRAYERWIRAQPGAPETIPIVEDGPLRESAYPRRRLGAGPQDADWSYDKIPVERAALAEPEMRGTVLRLPAVYGPGDVRRRRVGRYLARMVGRTSVVELDAGFARWRWTRGYVEDIADAIVTASTDPRAAGRIYNVGETDPVTEGDWVRAIARAAGYTGVVVERSRRELPESVALALDAYDFDHDLVLDTRRIRDELGWLPRVRMEDALAASVAWEREAVSRTGVGPE